MAKNIDPIYPVTPNISWATDVTVANNTADISTGTSYLVFTAGANGSYVSDIVVKMSPGVSTAATVMRAWLNNGAATTTVGNSVMIGEVSIPATTNSASQAMPDICLPIRRAIPAAYRIYVTVGTDPGATNLVATCFGGDY